MNRKAGKKASTITWVVTGGLALAAVTAMALIPTPSSWKVEVAETPIVAEPEDDENSAANWTSDAVATLTQAIDCQWPEDRQIATGSDIEKGQEIELLSGLASITFHSGAEVILEGPAKFDALTAASGFLRLGKMTAKVADDVQQFTISTPLAKIVDADHQMAAKKPAEKATKTKPEKNQIDPDLIEKLRALDRKPPGKTTVIKQDDRASEPIRVREGESFRIE